jgi:hypothetical protein
MDPLIATMRRFVVGFFNAHDPGVCAEIMSPDYTLTVGRHIISGRDAQYVPAVEQQFQQFPGLGMTVHALIAAPGRAALHFSEHGASGGAGGAVAVWSGVALYHYNGGQLTECFATEDYQARRRQLKSGSPDLVGPVVGAPWDVALGRPDPTAEDVVRRWLHEPRAATDPAVVFDDEHLGVGTRLEFIVSEADVLDLFSSDGQVAYAVAHRGTYMGGLDREPSATTVELFGTGIVTVADGQVVSGHAVRDRLGLARSPG